jgi:hypothetical protein
MIGSMIVFVIINREIILSQISLMKLVFFVPRIDGWVRAWKKWEMVDDDVGGAVSGSKV